MKNDIGWMQKAYFCKNFPYDKISLAIRKEEKIWED